MIPLAPLVSVIVVVRNEAGYIARCLDSLKQQTYPRDQTEWIMVDGVSTDATRDILGRELEMARKMGIRCVQLDNPARILASGWNLGIAAAAGDVVCRVDAHSELSPDYLANGVRHLIECHNEGVVCVGGVLVNRGEGTVGAAAAALSSSRFGLGGAPFRTGLRVPLFTDTAVFGLYRKDIFSEVGVFDETLKRNQDVELHARVRAQGYRFLTCPDMTATYHVRPTVGGLARKAFGDGFWVAALKRPSLRHVVPVTFVLYLLVLLPCLMAGKAMGVPAVCRYLLVLPLASYMCLAVFSSAVAVCGTPGRFLLLLLFPLVHVAYGAGTLIGGTRLAVEGVRRRTR